MRIIILLSVTLSFLISDAKLIASIDKTLQKVIHESKIKEVTDIKISYDPFNTNKPKSINTQTKKSTKFQQTKMRKHPSKLALSMIFNKSALINGIWYKENEKLADYRIIKINQNIVVLRKNNKYTTLKLPQSNMILVTKEEIQ
jgi:hypothetical protein